MYGSLFNLWLVVLIAQLLLTPDVHFPTYSLLNILIYVEMAVLEHSNCSSAIIQVED
jgi:hypothetical protein